MYMGKIKMPIDLDQARARLEARKQEILNESEIAAQARETVTLDQQSVGRLSRMDAMQAQAMAQAQERQRKADLVRIEMALRRLNDGEYGYCVECDEAIPEKRLKIDPMAERCIGCA